jgi:hypothetical protein
MTTTAQPTPQTTSLAVRAHALPPRERPPTWVFPPRSRPGTVHHISRDHRLRRVSSSRLIRAATRLLPVGAGGYRRSTSTSPGVARAAALPTSSGPASGSPPARSSAARAACAAERRMWPTWSAFANGCRYAAAAASPAACAACFAASLGASLAARCASKAVALCSLVRLAPFANSQAAPIAALGRGSPGVASSNMPRTSSALWTAKRATSRSSSIVSSK